MVIFDRKKKQLYSAKLTAFLPTYKITTSLNILPTLFFFFCVCWRGRGPKPKLKKKKFKDLGEKLLVLT